MSSQTHAGPTEVPIPRVELVPYPTMADRSSLLGLQDVIVRFREHDRNALV